MATARKRSQSKHRAGTAGKRKTAARKAPATKARTKTEGRVKGMRGGAVSGHKPRHPTKRASSHRRALEKGEPLTKHAAALRKKPATDISDEDVVRVPGLARARARDLGSNSG